MGWNNTHKSNPIWVTRWCEELSSHHARPFNIKLGHYTSCSMWQHVFWMLTRKASWTNIDNTKEFSTYNANLAFSNPMHIDKTRLKPLMKQEKQCRHRNNLCLYYRKPSHGVHECPKKCGPHVACAILICYQSAIRGVGKQACLVSIGTTSLDLNVSCIKNCPILFSNPTPCFLIPIIVKCSKVVTMEA
jgi:hypothetical protein